MAKQESRRARPALFNYVQAIMFMGFMGATAIAINFIQFPTIPILLVSTLPFAKALYAPCRRWIRFTQAMFASLLVALSSAFCPVQIVLIGTTEDLDAFDPQHSRIIMANHQIYSDWWWLWLLAWSFHGSSLFRIILKKSLRYLPIYGWGMQFFDFIFLARKWSIDRVIIAANLIRAQSENLPLWLLIFPEGTIITEDTREKSLAYAKKTNIPDRPNHVLIPKATGLFFCLKTMAITHLTNSNPASAKKGLIDVTIAYEGLQAGDTPYQTYSIADTFFNGRGPKRICMHVQAFDITTIPGLQQYASENPETHQQMKVATLGSDEDHEAELFASWLRKRFMEKDSLMDSFYKTGSFPPKADHQSKIINIQLKARDLFNLGCAFSLGSLVFYNALQVVRQSI